MQGKHTPPESPVGQQGTSALLGVVQRLRQILALATVIGLLFGLGEGAIDLTILHFHAPEILYFTVLGNLLIFLILGLFFGALGIGLEQGTSYALASFVLLWIAFRGWTIEFDPQATRDSFWWLSLISTGIIAWAISFYTAKHSLKARRVVARTLPLLAGAVLICFAGIYGSHLWAQQRAGAKLPRISADAPNVVLVIVDTLRADHLSSYGYHRLTSAHFDQLAGKGVLFEEAIAPSSWTLPSHASMLTGLYSNEHGALRSPDQLPANIPTLAEVLSKAGYRTAAISGSPFFTRRQGFGRGFDDFQDLFLNPMFALSQVHYLSSIINYMIHERWIQEVPGKETAADVNRNALSWIDRARRPFFLALNYYDVHGPDFVSGVPANLAVPRNPQSRIDDYDGDIAYDDAQLQRLMDELERRRLLDNTLVIVTGDHGEGLGEHGLWVHRTVPYIQLIRVPLVFSWPGRIPVGLRLDRPVSTKDIAATILAVLGMSKDSFPGESLADLWTGRTDPSEWPPPISELALATNTASGPRNQSGLIQSIVSSNMQLILDPSAGPLLYDLQTDPRESTNLFFDPRYQAIGLKLAKVLKSTVSVQREDTDSKLPGHSLVR